MSEPVEHCGHQRPVGSPLCYDCIDDLQAQVERLTEERDTHYEIATRFKRERDEAHRQLAAVVEKLTALNNVAGGIANCYDDIDDDERREESAVILADLSAAAKEIGATLERAEKLAEALETHGWV